MSNTKWFWLAAASLALASCGGGGGGGEPSATPDPVTGTPAPTPSPSPLPVVGTGPAADCFNEALYPKGTITRQSLLETNAAGESKSVSIYTAVRSPADFHGVIAPHIEELYTEGDVTTLVKRYFQRDGLALTAVGSISGTVTSTGGLLFERTVQYAAPLPVDKSFTLQPGQADTTSFTAFTTSPGATAAVTTTYAITSHYLGQEALTIQGKAYNTCKFRFDDSRDGSTNSTWLIKSDANGSTLLRGIIGRSEIRLGNATLTREILSGTVGMEF